MQPRQAFPFNEETQNLQSLWQWVKSWILDLNGCMLNIGFGDGVSPDNVAGVWVTIADTGLANTDFAVPHTLGQLPVGFLIIVPPSTGYINKGATGWTSTNIYLKCSTANQAVTLFVLPPSFQPI